MEIDETYVTATLHDLVAINSINPAFSDGTTNEARISVHIGALLRDLGMQVSFYETAPGRPSVVGRLAGNKDGPSRMLNGHIDTVGVDGMDEPFAAVVKDGRLYGRGADDMKGGVVACIAAVKAIVDAGIVLDGDLIVAAVTDEETESAGMMEVLQHVRPDAAIVTEPIELDICIAHKGFCWIEVETKGRAAHGSKHLDGIDANLQMGRFSLNLHCWLTHCNALYHMSCSASPRCMRLNQGWSRY